MIEKIVVFVLSVLAVALVGGIILGLMYGIPAFSRYQSRQYAQNEVLVNEIIIAQQAQLIQVEQQKAAIRVAEAKGIAESQRIIDSSLTNNYLQYLAIKAQEKMAGSPNHTQIYIPVGTNGIPLVKTIDTPVAPAVTQEAK